jgi:dTDP-4-dehydrorhamnose reductase
VEKPRLLVTGGSGYLGDWVVRLACTGWDVTATYLSHPVDGPGASWRRLDVRDRSAVAGLVAEIHPAVIIHTAAMNPGAGRDFRATNIAGSYHVARAAAEWDARLVHVSTDVVFDGEQGGYVEEDPPSPVTPYGRSKARAEELVEQAGAEAVIVRTSLIYGWRPEIDRHTGWMLDKLAADEPVRLFTDELRCPIWVETLAAALIELAGMDVTGWLHVAGAQILDRYAFGQRLLQFHGVDPAPLVPALSRESGLHRPLDCTLDISRAQALLATPLPGVDEVLGSHSPEST